MRRWLFIAIPLLLAALPAWPQEVVVRTSRQPDGQVVLGQPVHVLVDVLFPSGMKHPPRVATPRVNGAQVLRFESQATTITDRLGDTPVTGQRFEFDLYPRRAGTLTVPPAQVTLLDETGDPTGSSSGEPLSVNVVAPRGLDPSGPIVASSQVTLRESWEPPDANSAFHVGDALVRIVTRRAADVPGLALAALTFPVPDGVRAYVDPPVIEDNVERGVVTGQRTDRVAYVFEQAGTYTLPGLTQPWWDLASRSARIVTTPPRHVEIASAAAPETLSPRAWLIGLVLVLMLLLALVWLVASIRRRHPAVTDPERAAFRSLRYACRHAEAVPVYRAWQRWNAVRSSRAMGPDLSDALAVLERHLFAHTDEWDAAAARRLAVAARAARAHSAGRVRRSALPPLNPLPRPRGTEA
jgi:hypothetical protein